METSLPFLLFANTKGIQAAKEGSPQHTGDSLARSSVFDFINQSSKSDLPSLDDLGKDYTATDKLGYASTLPCLFPC